MRKRTRHTIELAPNLTGLNSCSRDANTPQAINFDLPAPESQENQPVCKNGVCTWNWKPVRRWLA